MNTNPTLDDLQRQMAQNGGWLDLSDTAITALPNGLTVGGWLYLSDTAITALPDGLTVGGSLDLRGTAITALPNGLTVGGWLDLRGTAITVLPDRLTVGGWLHLSGTAITALPDGLTVGRSLDLSGDGVTYSVLVSPGQMKIGCEDHPIAFWRALDDRRAIAMNGKKAVKFWAVWGAELIRWHDAKFVEVPA